MPPDKFTVTRWSCAPESVTVSLSGSQSNASLPTSELMLQNLTALAHLSIGVFSASCSLHYKGVRVILDRCQEKPSTLQAGQSQSKVGVYMMEICGYSPKDDMRQLVSSWDAALYVLVVVVVSLQ